MNNIPKYSYRTVYGAGHLPEGELQVKVGRSVLYHYH